MEYKKYTKFSYLFTNILKTFPLKILSLFIDKVVYLTVKCFLIMGHFPSFLVYLKNKFCYLPAGVAGSFSSLCLAYFRQGKQVMLIFLKAY